MGISSFAALKYFFASFSIGAVVLSPWVLISLVNYSKSQVEKSIQDSEKQKLINRTINEKPIPELLFEDSATNNTTEDLSVNTSLKEFKNLDSFKESKMLPYEEFKKNWNYAGLEIGTTEGNYSQSINNRKINDNKFLLEAWELFFLDSAKNKPSWYEDFELPLLNPQIPFMLVEFPKDYVDVPKDWIEITKDTKISELSNKLFVSENGELKKNFEDLLKNQKRYEQYLIQNKDRQLITEFLNRSISAQDHSRVFAVTSPKYLLRRWLKDWDKTYEEVDLKSNTFSEFEITWYDSSNFFSSPVFAESNILKRVYKGEKYRLMIFLMPWKSKTLKICDNPKRICDYAENVVWSKNFLLSLATGFVYSWKPSWKGSEPKSFEKRDLISVISEHDYGHAEEPRKFFKNVYYQHLPWFVKVRFKDDGSYSYNYYWTYNNNEGEKNKYINLLEEAARLLL